MNTFGNIFIGDCNDSGTQILTPSLSLRFKDGKLQQLFTAQWVSNFNGLPTIPEMVWRDVPGVE